MNGRVGALVVLTVLLSVVAQAQCGGGGGGGGDPFADCGLDNSCSEPILVNLEPGSYRLSGIDDPVRFDIHADGRPLKMAWTARNAAVAFLALDRNGNGMIDNGAELFGNASSLPDGTRATNGFAALAAYDTTHDGVIDANDPIWPSLLLWTDLNHNGISEPSEIVLLSGSSVTAISLDYHWAGRRDASGNTFRYESRVRMAGGLQGEERPVYDIFFVSIP